MEINGKSVKKGFRHGSWGIGYAAVVLAAAVVVCNGVLPLLDIAIRDGKRIYTQYVRKRDARSLPDVRKRTRREIALLDSLLLRLDMRDSGPGKAFTEELYRYAGESRFQIGRVEAGVPQRSNTHSETTFQIEGTGTYQSVGKLVEQMENCPQSTRIRNLSLTKDEKKGALKLYVDVAVREETRGDD